MDEGQVALSHDGTMGALLHGVAAAWAESRLSPARVDLRQDCGGDVVTSVGSPSLTVTRIEAPLLPDMRPAMSTDGSRLLYYVWNRVGPSPVHASVHLAGVAGSLADGGVPLAFADDFDPRSPRPQIAANGSVAWVMYVPTVNSPQKSRFWDLPPGPVDPAALTPCNVVGLAPGVAQPAFTPDGSHLACHFDDGVTRSVVRVARPGATWCAGALAPKMLASLDPIPGIDSWSRQYLEVRDVTLSSDGKVVAWTSDVDHCDSGLGPLPTRDLWLWYEEGVSPPAWATNPCPGASPTAPGTLVRVPLDALASGAPPNEEFAVLAPDASFALVVSTGEFRPNANPLGRQQLIEVSLTGGVLEVQHLSPPIMTNAGVVAASLSGDGRVAAYTLDHSTLVSQGGGDNYLVVRDRGAEVAAGEPPGVPPAEEPYEMELLQCQAGPPGFVSATVRLRQWAGPARVLVLTGEIVDEGGVAPTAPLTTATQDLAAGMSVDVTLEAAFAGSMPSCRVRAISGEASHPDVVTAWRRP